MPFPAPPPATVLATERLVLRQAALTDLPALLSLWTDPDVTRHMGGPRDPAVIRPLIEADAAAKAPARLGLWTLVERASGAVVGDCGLLEKEVDGRKEVEVTYVIARDRWGRGYATEVALALLRHAREGLGLARVVALIDPENAASESVARKIGLVEERTTRRPSGKVLRLYAAPTDPPRP